MIDSLIWTEIIPLNGTGQLYIIIEGEREGKLKGNVMQLVFTAKGKHINVLHVCIPRQDQLKGMRSTLELSSPEIGIQENAECMHSLTTS